MTMTTDAPSALAAIPTDRVIELDVREDLRNGLEPFSRIMAARQQVPAGGALRLRAIFEPVPLYRVMEKQGFDHWTEELAPDDWRVTFYPAEAGSMESGSAAPVESGGAAGAEAEEEIIILDVRGMEPPEPMVRTLAALEELPVGMTLLQINERVPQFLLPKLEGLGFSYRVQEQDDTVVRVFIRRSEAA